MQNIVCVLQGVSFAICVLCIRTVYSASDVLRILTQTILDVVQQWHWPLTDCHAGHHSPCNVYLS